MVTVVEIVGVPGSGKTTTIRSMPKLPDVRVMALYEHDSWAPRFRGAAKGALLSIRFRLSFREAIALVLDCSTVEVGLLAYKRAWSSGDAEYVFLDEGPIRILGTAHFRTERGLAAWRRYTERTMAKIGKWPINVRLVRFELDKAVCSKRLHQRQTYWREQIAMNRTPLIWRLRRKLNELSGRQLGPPLNRFNLAVYIDECFARNSAAGYRLLEHTIQPDEPPERVATRLVSLIRSDRKV